MATRLPDDFLVFLGELAAHNERAWFTANKTRYERNVRDPFLQVLVEFGPHLREVSEYFVVDPRPSGGSMLRIYRDTRFSKDKTPYKTAVAAHFGHRDGTQEGAPGFYVHLQPGNCAFGVGAWQPGTTAQGKIRDAIVARPEQWLQATQGHTMRAGCGWIGESLKRPPAGYDPQHPLVQDLKRKDFALSMPIEPGTLTDGTLVATLTEKAKAAAPFARFLSEALGLQF